jgi:hypothetical protein
MLIPLNDLKGKMRGGRGNFCVGGWTRASMGEQDDPLS